jgi:predicted permease
VFRPPSFRRAFRHEASTRAELDAELREEIEAHIVLRADELVRHGMAPDAAFAEARRKFGDVDAALPALTASARRRTARVRARERLHAVWRDAAVGARQLRRAPAFALGVVLCLGFGIGSSATVYSWMRGMVLRPLPAVRDVERLVTVRFDDARGERGSIFVSAPEYREWRDASRSVRGLAAVDLHAFGVQTDGAGGGAAEPVYGMFASANYFAVLGVAPAVGRAFVAADDESPGAAAVAVLGDAFWRSRFGADSAVVGRRIRVNGHPVTVIGVAPRGFGGTLAGVQFDLWVPLAARPLLVPGDAARWGSRALRTVDVIGRLAPGVTMAQAAAEFRAIGRRQLAAFPETGTADVRVQELDVGVASQLRPLFWSLTALTGVVLLVVCSNVANLLLVRAAARARELAVRRSLGATRARLVGQLLTESAVLAALGAAAGVALAAVGGRLLGPLLPVTSVPLAVGARLDIPVLAYVVGVTGLAVLAFGLAPALAASRADAGAALKDGGRGNAGARGRLRGVLVVAQCALSLTALVCAALFLSRARYLETLDRGFADPERVLLLQTDMSFAGYRDVAAWQRTLDEAAGRLRRLPGVRSVALATYVPLGFFHPRRQPLAVEGGESRPGRAGAAADVLVNGVGPDYFTTMGIPIRAGRAVTADDAPGRPGVAVVNETFARVYLGAGSPIGRRVVLGGRELTVVGVAKDGRYEYKAVDEPPPPLAYYALRQAPGSLVTFHVRTAGDPATLVAPARAAIREADAGVPVIAPTSLAEYTAVPMFPARVGVAVLGVLGAAALGLAAMGLYAVIAYGVALRRREVGIRLALGGTGARVVRLFVRDTVRLLGAGLAAGGPMAALAVVVLRSELAFLPAPTAAAFAAPAALLVLAALVAGYLPARRSARVDVVAALRAE